MDEIALVAAPIAALGCAVVISGGMVRIALYGILGVAFGAMCGGALIAVLMSIVSSQIHTAVLTSVDVTDGAFMSYARSLLLASSLPSVTSMALIALALLVSYYVRLTVRVAADVEVLFTHLAAYGSVEQTS
jgi:hypothetical protein